MKQNPQKSLPVLSFGGVYVVQAEEVDVKMFTSKPKIISEAILHENPQQLHQLLLRAQENDLYLIPIKNEGIFCVCSR